MKIAKNLQVSHYGLRGRCNRGRKTAIVNIASAVVSIAPVVVLIMVAENVPRAEQTLRSFQCHALSRTICTSIALVVVGTNDVRDREQKITI